MFKKLIILAALLLLPVNVWALVQWRQDHFRFRNDDGSESAATWKAATDTNVTIDVSAGDVVLRYRIAVCDAGVTSGALTEELYFSYNSGTYAQVTGSTTNIQANAGGGFITDDQATTKQISTYSTFVSGFCDINDGACAATASITHGCLAGTEHEYCLILKSANLNNNDTIDLKGYASGVAFFSYVQIGRITITKGGGGGPPTTPLLLQLLGIGL